MPEHAKDVGGKSAFCIARGAGFRRSLLNKNTVDSHCLLHALPSRCVGRVSSTKALSQNFDHSCCRHYEALVANKMIPPIPTTPLPAAPSNLQLSVADSSASRLIRRREAAQAREAKRKTAIIPHKSTEISHLKPGKQHKQKPPQTKGTAGIRKTGKSRLAPPVAVAPNHSVAPPLDLGLSNVLRLVHAKKVQPTHVGRTGKPAAVVDGKSVHFMQRHVQ